MSSFFSEIRDQDTVIQQLEKDILNNKISHAYLFIGKNGIGKKLTAINFARTILCGLNKNKLNYFNNNMNRDFLSFYDNGKSFKLENTREIIKEICFTKFDGSYRIIFIENIERMTEESSNALLKILEDPPINTIFILTSSESNNLPETLLSRVKKYYFNSLSKETIKSIFNKEKYKNISFKENDSIDKLNILLNNKKEKILLFDEFIKLFSLREIIQLFKYAEYLYKKPYTKLVLNYYEIEAEKKFSKNIANNKYSVFYESIIFAIEEAIKKINKNINEKHALEYCFLKILNKTKKENA